MVVVGMLGVSATAPAGAQGFLGESSVLNGAKTDLTGPAKTILTKPTFLPANVAEAGVLGGVAEESAAARVFQAGGLLPALGGVLAFGVGTVIGSEICNVVGIEGCWYFGSEGADPAAPGTGSWKWNATNLTPPVPAYTFYYKYNAEPYWEGPVKGYFGTPEGCGVALAVVSGTTEVQKGITGKVCSVDVNYALMLRDSMTNRTLDYHATDDPEISNYSYTAPSDWSEKTAAALKEQEGTAAGRVGEKIASEIEGSGVSNPYAVTVTVPSCAGEAWVGCEELLEELELVPERSELTWEDAHLDLDADAVVETVPAGGAVVEVGSKVVVTTNPDEAGMPVLIPQPEPGETYDDYAARLAPSLEPSRVTVSPEFTDPGTGPDGVIRTVPKSGTRTNPATETEVDVQTNPPDAPPAAGVWAAPSIPALDLSPLAGVAIGCNDFPFGIFCWIGAGLTSWGPGGECPAIGVPMGSSIGLSDELEFDLCQFEPAMEVVRPVLILLSAFCLAYLFAAAAMGFGGSTGSDD